MLTGHKDTTAKFNKIAGAHSDGDLLKKIGVPAQTKKKSSLNPAKPTNIPLNCFVLGASASLKEGFLGVVRCSSALLGVPRRSSVFFGVPRCCSVFLGVAGWCCSVFLGVVRCSSVLLGVAWCCSVFLGVAWCCSLWKCSVWLSVVRCSSVFRGAARCCSLWSCLVLLGIVVFFGVFWCCLVFFGVVLRLGASLSTVRRFRMKRNNSRKTFEAGNTAGRPSSFKVVLSWRHKMPSTAGVLLSGPYCGCVVWGQWQGADVHNHSGVANMKAAWKTCPSVTINLLIKWWSLIWKLYGQPMHLEVIANMNLGGVWISQKVVVLKFVAGTWPGAKQRLLSQSGFCHLDGRNRQSPTASVQRTRSFIDSHCAISCGKNVKRMDANRAIRIAAQRTQSLWGMTLRFRASSDRQRTLAIQSQR